MPCMCGDLCCSSCGPAQGNWKCPICNIWKSEGCHHINSRTGELKVAYRKQAEDQAKAEAEAEAQAYIAEEQLIFRALDDGDDPSMFADWIVKKWKQTK